MQIAQTWRERCCVHLATAKRAQMKISASLLTSASASFVCVNQSGCGSVVRNGNDPPCVNRLTAVWISLHILASSGICWIVSLPVYHWSVLYFPLPVFIIEPAVSICCSDISPHLCTCQLRRPLHTTVRNSISHPNCGDLLLPPAFCHSVVGKRKTSAKTASCFLVMRPCP